MVLFPKFNSISFSEMQQKLSQFDSELLSRKKTASAFKQMKGQSWTSDLRFYEIEPLIYPELRIFKNDNPYFIVYKHFGDKIEYVGSSYSKGFLTINDEGKFPVCEYVSLDYSFDGGNIFYKDEEIKQIHKEQLLLPYFEKLGFSKEEGLLKLEEKIGVYLVHFFFIVNNIEYKPFESEKEWSFSFYDNSFFFDGQEYNYWNLEEMSKDYILRNYSEYIHFDNKNDAHRVFSTMLRFLEKEGLISIKNPSILDAQDLRLQTIQWLGISPENNNPPVKQLSLNKIEQVVVKEGEEIQLKPEFLKEVILADYKLVEEFPRKEILSLNVILKDNLEGKIIELRQGVALISFKCGERTRVPANFLQTKKEIISNFDFLEKECFEIIENYKKEKEENRKKVAKDCLSIYLNSSDKESIKQIIVITMELDFSFPYGFKEKSDEIEIQKDIWREVFKETDLIIE